jgi:hypothetical protein
MDAVLSRIWSCKRLICKSIQEVAGTGEKKMSQSMEASMQTDSDLDAIIADRLRQRVDGADRRRATLADPDRA